MPLVDFDELKRQIPLRRVLDSLQWTPTRREDTSERGWCPLHSRHPHPSRSFAVRGDGWYCHSCKDGGDVVRLWQKLHRLTPYQAALDLCRRFGVTTPVYDGRTAGLFNAEQEEER